eukprot:15365025-Ditylum_brightwellii.AAC.1
MKEKKDEKAGKGGEKKYQPSNNFKIVLSAMLLDEDFKPLEAHALHILTLVVSLAVFWFWLTFEMPKTGVTAGFLPMQLCLRVWMVEIWMAAACWSIRRFMSHATVLVTHRQKTSNNKSRWQQINVTRQRVLAYLGTKDLIGQFGHGETDKPKEKTLKKDRPDEIRGQHRVGFLGQEKKIVKNCMYLLLLINIIQGRNLRLKADRAKHQGSRIYRFMRTPLQSLGEILQNTSKGATKKCRNISVEGLNEGSMMYHTCLLEEQIALANEGVALGAEETENMCFLKEDSTTEFGLDNCCTIPEAKGLRDCSVPHHRQWRDRKGD